MNTQIHDIMSGATPATLTKNQLFERFLKTALKSPNGYISTPEDRFDYCEKLLADQPESLIDSIRASDDPEWELGEIAEQIMGCADDLFGLLVGFRAFIARHEKEGVRVMTRVCVPSASGSRIYGEYEERGGMVHVYFEGRTISTQINNLAADSVAITLLRRMVTSAA